MYDLGDHFKVDYEAAKANPASIIIGKKYRITVLTERLIRFEYSKNGIFEDRPTEIVKFRNFKRPVFEYLDDENHLEIMTTKFKVSYVKEKKFKSNKLNPGSKFRVDILNSDRFWYFGHPEVRNYGAPGVGLKDRKNKVSFAKSLYSIDGFVSIDDSKSSIVLENGAVVKRDEDVIDTYLFVYDKDFSLCLQDYYAITGYPPLIPRYALGNWWSRNIAYDDLKLKNLIDDFEKHEVPISLILLDKDWHKRVYDKDNNHLKTGFTFNDDYFKAPFEMIGYLNSKGIRVGLSINPSEGIYPIERYYEEVRKYVPADEKGVIPFNIFDPKFVDVYLKILIHPLDAIGADFYFIDYSDKKTPADIHLLKHYHFYDMMRNYKKRPMVLGYNSLIVPHLYPVLYSGKSVVSWKTLEKIPFHNANAANIGVTWWSHDIGGYFKGTEDDELYTRFVQLGVFSPILKFGTDDGKYYKREPWKWNIKTFTIAKEFLELRHKLIPYLYNEAYKYHKYGTPVVQPLYYKYAELYDDPIYCNEYFFGSEMFISPIITKKDNVMIRSIHRSFVPEGIWYDFFTGKKFIGNQKYVLFYQDQDYPAFVKAGGIIPLGYSENLNDTTPPTNMEIHVFPGANNIYTLYEDDGISSLYKKDFYFISTIEYNYLKDNYTVIVRAKSGKSGIVPAKRNYKIVFRNTKLANEVTVYQNKIKIDAKSYVKGSDFVVEVDDVKTIGQLTVNCRGKDLNIDAVQIINEDIEKIISDLEIETEMKEKIDEILFGDLPINKKRIAIRKLKRKGLKKDFIKLFLKLLEYIKQV